jgi:hypothetical protein
MYTINLISIPFVLLIAWAKGRGLIRWAFMAYIFGFWSILVLFLVKNRPIKLYQIPQPLKDLVTARAFKRELKEVEYPLDLQKDI